MVNNTNKVDFQGDAPKGDDPSGSGSDSYSCLTSKVSETVDWHWLCESTDCDKQSASLHCLVRLIFNSPLPRLIFHAPNTPIKINMLKALFDKNPNAFLSLIKKEVMKQAKKNNLNHEALEYVIKTSYPDTSNESILVS
jgi:hypothetical protein